jgi:trigger factor
VEPVDTPDIGDVTLEEGQALTFTASFDTVPSFDPGEFSTLLLRRPSSAVGDAAVEQALQRLRERAARYEPVEGRGVADGDSVTLDIERSTGRPAVSAEAPADKSTRPGVPADRHTDVSVELGAPANPPGFDRELLGLEVGATRTFTVQYPADYPAREMAGTEVSYTVLVKAIKRRVLPELDDEFGKDLGDFATLDELRARVRHDLEHEARHSADRELRAALLKQLASRVPFEVPGSLVEREIDRRIEDFVRRLIDQRIDPREAGVDWNGFRESQREVAGEAVAAGLALDEIARRERLEVGEDELAQEIERHAARTGRTPAAVRAALDKESGLSRVQAGLRREKAIDFVMARATIARE